MALEFDSFSLDTGGLTLASDSVRLDGAEAPSTESLKGVDVEKVALEEMSENLKGFKERAAYGDQRMLNEADSEFWFAVYFQTRAQKEEFLEKLGILVHGDKYISGMLLAETLHIELESPVPPMPSLRIDPKLASLAQKITRRVQGTLRVTE